MNDWVFRQLFDHKTCTYSYLLGDPETKEALLIDPVREWIQRDIKLVQELELNLKFVLETHIHADHVTAAGKIREMTGATIVVSKNSGIKDIPHRKIDDGDQVTLGSLKIEVMGTPGHTNTCVSYYLSGQGGGRVFTGDALFIRGCGRTDFQGGSSEKLFHSVRKKLFSLPPETRVYPGHDYCGCSHSTIEEEMKFNPRLQLDHSFEKFSEMMANLKLDPPQDFEKIVSANLLLGMGDSL